MPSEAYGEAHRLVMAAAGCWFGGPWADALGEQAVIKEKGIEARCHDLERRTWGGAEDKTHYEQLRALERNAVADVLAKVDETARSEHLDGSSRDALVRLASALADEEKELMLARRAADRVKRDLDREPEKLTADEIDAVVPLRAHEKLDALVSVRIGGLTEEAHALALLCVLDRVELARGLPKHLKLYAVADEFHIFFGVDVPEVPRDATTKLVPGTWLKFLSETAAAAGYPVGTLASTPRERDALAWAGMLHGLSDRLKVAEDAIPPNTDLSHVVTVARHRLEAEYNAQKAADQTLHPATARDH
ncbi:MAG: hypothetical protein WBY94_08030 [Polyangiaceae bacterium]